MNVRIRLAFTLVEVLTVVGIIGVLVGLLLPAVHRIREAANRVLCTNNLKQIGLATHSYENRFGYYPPSRDGKFGDKHGASWSWLILADLGEESLFRQWDYKNALPGANSLSRAAFATPVSLYFCPSRSGPRVSEVDRVVGALNDYAGCAGTTGDDVGILHGGKITPTAPNGVFQHAGIAHEYYSMLHIPKKIRYVDITDGLSQTILVGEKYVNGGAGRSDGDIDQAYTGDRSVAPPPMIGFSIRCVGSPPGFLPILGPETIKLAWIPEGFGSEHPGICQFVFCDGRVVSLRTTTDVVILGLLARRNDGVAIPIDY